MCSEKVRLYKESEQYKSQLKTGYVDLNPSTGVYTKTGIFLEKFKLVELPELFHVLSGQLSFVGNRALPPDLHRLVCLASPKSTNRVSTGAGIFGPVQIIGRSKLTSDERIAIELDYSDVQSSSYSATLDISLLLLNLFSISFPTRSPSLHAVYQIILAPSRKSLLRSFFKIIIATASNPP